MVDAKEGETVVTSFDEDKDDEEEGKDEDDASAPQVAKKTRGINMRRLQRKKKKAQVTPKVQAMDVTLVLRVSLSNLPINLLGNMASVAIEENEQELLNLLHQEQTFYTFFKLIDGVDSRTIDELTKAPTVSPTTRAYYEAVQAEKESEGLDADGENEDDSGAGIGEYYVALFNNSLPNKHGRSLDCLVFTAVYVGLGIGFLWCCLTGISVAYLLNARGEMDEQRDMENLLRAERQGFPLDGPVEDGTISLKSGKSSRSGNTDEAKQPRKSSTVPLRESDSSDEFDESPELWDHSKNSRLKSSARVELSRSSNEDAPQRKSKNRMSMTSQEKKAVSENRRASAPDSDQGDGVALYHSAGPKTMGSDARPKGPLRRLSKSMVLPKSNVDALKKELAKKDAKVMRRNSGVFAKSMVAPKRSSTPDKNRSSLKSSLKRSANKGSSDNLAGIRRSNTDGSRNSLRQSSKSNDKSTSRRKKRSSTGDVARSGGRDDFSQSEGDVRRSSNRKSTIW